MTAISKQEGLEKLLFGRNLRGLYTLFMLTREESKSATIKQILVIMFATIMAIMQFVDLWLVRYDAKKVFNNMSFTITTSICYLKYLTFILGKKPWTAVIEHINKVDQRNRSRRNHNVNVIIQEYTNYSKNVDYLYAFLVTFTIIITIVSPFILLLLSPEAIERVKAGVDPYPEILSSWVPFDKSRGYGYYVLLMMQILLYCWGGGVIWCYDSTIFKTMTFFAGQFKLLALSCRNIFGDGTEILPTHEVLRRIKQCHNDHVILFKYIEIFAGVWMPVLFIYLILCSLSICGCTARLTSQSTSGLHLLLLAQFLIALVFQLFLYCWYSTDVSYTSNGVEYSVFESTWVTQDVRIRRSLILLAGQLRRQVVFHAGPFTKLNLTTFIMILKASYSYYTLLNEKKTLN